MQRTRRFNNCGLSSSVYQTCYSDSLMDNARSASVCSIQTMEMSESESHPAEKTTTNNNRAAGKEVTFYIGSIEAADEDVEIEDESEDCGSCYEEECHFGLQKLLSHSLKEQAMSLFCSHFGVGTSVLGLTEVLPSVITQLLHLSEDEPYGIRGANLTLVLDRPTSSSSRASSRKSSVMSTTSSSSSAGNGNGSTASSSSGNGNGFNDYQHHNELSESDVLGTMKLCYETVTTFELILTLREGRNLAVSIRNWMANVFRSKQVVVIEPSFTLHKKKLYRS